MNYLKTGNREAILKKKACGREGRDQLDHL